ncbi:MAG: RpiB/LacA/LacB family sugar-phosphate isomerase [Nanoarchaeota archaeon]|mgnify:FL=1
MLVKEEVLIASDHAGFKTKEKLKSFLEKLNIQYKDLGPFSLEKSDDYPEYAFKLGKEVVKNNSKGILLCGSGSGMSIAANKVKGARAVQIYDSYSARTSRADNNANIACLRSRSSSFEKIKQLIKTWLSTEFSKEKRHIRRINKIHNFEK